MTRMLAVERAGIGGGTMGDVVVETDVLIVGGGAAGLTASILLSQQGVRTLLVNAWPHSSQLPKAHILNQRTMEIFAEAGVAEAIYAKACPPRNMRYSAMFAGLAGTGPDYGRTIVRMESWGAGGDDTDYVAASPFLPANLPQIRLEPLLRARAEALAPGHVRFGQDMISFEDKGDHICATILDHPSQATYQVRAQYMLGCDGGRTVGPALGIGMDDLGTVKSRGRVVTVYMTADLSAWVTDPEVQLRMYYNPDSGRSLGLLAVGPTRWGPDSEEWVCHQFYGFDDPRAFDDEEVLADLRRELGIGSHPIHVHIVTRWSFDGMLARQFQKGRVFLLGDAAHRHPPSGGLGLNSAVQDAHNLSWKIASVLDGVADVGLLATYEEERRPVAEHNVRRSLENGASQADVPRALGISAKADPTRNWNALRLFWGDTADSRARRHEVRRAAVSRTMELREHNVDYGYVYRSSAISPDGAEPEALEPVRLYQAGTTPGHPLPHAWLVDDEGAKIAVSSLVRPGRFLLIAGEEGADWCAQAQTLDAEGFPIDAVRIGHLDGDYFDHRCAWLRHRGIGAKGAILVRPDRYISWRSTGSVADPGSMLRSALLAALGKPIPARTASRKASQVA